MGHTVRLVPPQFVKAFVKGNKSDVSDAEAIAEAATRPNMRFVPIKEIEHQEMQFLHCIRERLVKNRVALSNQVRGILYEHGLTVRKGDKALKTTLALVTAPVGADEPRLSQGLKAELALLYEEFLQVEQRLKENEGKIEDAAKQNEVAKRLMKMPGVGPLIATAMTAAIPDPHAFSCGRQVSAWLGLVPGHTHTGGPTKKTVMLPITKRGDRYLRKLIIQGARTWVKVAASKSDRLSRWVERLHREKGFNKAAVALANKNTRIMWALLAHGSDYSTEFQAKRA
jgi:transposase